MLRRFFTAQKRLLDLQKEVRELRRENEKLRGQNESMRNGMRRCVTCDYRLDYKARQGKAPVLDKTPASTSDTTSQ